MALKHSLPAIHDQRGDDHVEYRNNSSRDYSTSPSYAPSDSESPSPRPLDAVSRRRLLTPTTGNARPSRNAKRAAPSDTASTVNKRSASAPRSKKRKHDNDARSMSEEASARRSAPAIPVRRLYLRRRHIVRSHRTEVNPITAIPRYALYRENQEKHRESGKQVWPDILEDAFMDAFWDIPKDMGQQKFCHKNVPYGRNMLISEYMKIACALSCPPGQVSPFDMERDRKQISSHIQVIKKYVEPYPEIHAKCFPPSIQPKHGFVPSFKRSEVLKRLCEGYLPPHRMLQYQCLSQLPPVEPTEFYIELRSETPLTSTSKFDGNVSQDALSSEVYEHEYTRLAEHVPTANLETLPQWRSRFPDLARLHAHEDFDYDIIHLDVALALTADHAPIGSELLGRMVLSLASREPDQSEWRALTTFNRPTELRCAGGPTARREDPMEVRLPDAASTALRVPFPAEAWALTLASLVQVQLASHDNKHGFYSAHPFENPAVRVRRYVEQMTMYQELQSRCTADEFARRAVLLWTFRKCPAAGGGSTTWRYLEPTPPRHMELPPMPPPASQILRSSDVDDGGVAVTGEEPQFQGALASDGLSDYDTATMTESPPSPASMLPTLNIPYQAAFGSHARDSLEYATQTIAPADAYQEEADYITVDQHDKSFSELPSTALYRHLLPPEPEAVDMVAHGNLPVAVHWQLPSITAEAMDRGSTGGSTWGAHYGTSHGPAALDSLWDVSHGHSKNNMDERFRDVSAGSYSHGLGTSTGHEGGERHAPWMTLPSMDYADGASPFYHRAIQAGRRDGLHSNHPSTSTLWPPYAMISPHDDVADALHAKVSEAGPDELAPRHPPSTFGQRTFHANPLWKAGPEVSPVVTRSPSPPRLVVVKQERSAAVRRSPIVRGGFDVASMAHHMLAPMETSSLLRFQERTLG